LGHEEIAGFRGKVDPGHKFDWHYLLTELYPDVMLPKKDYALPEEFLSSISELKNIEDKSWAGVNSLLEKSVELLNKKR